MTFLSCIALLVAAIAWAYSVVSGGTVTVRQFDQDFATLNGVEYFKTYTLSSGRFWKSVVGEGLSVPLQEVDRTLTFATAHDAVAPAEAWRLWPLLGLLAILPAIALVLRFRRRAPRRSLGAVVCELGTWIGVTLFVTAIVFFCRSLPYFERLDVRVRQGPAALQVNSARGSLMLAWTESGPAKKLREPGAFLFQRSTVARNPHPLAQDAGFDGTPSEVFGFAWGGDGTTSIGRNNIIVMPYWFVLLVIALATMPSAIGVRRERRRGRRARAGLCIGCGYDIRGIDGRCPECGLAIDRPAPPVASVEIMPVVRSERAPRVHLLRRWFLDRVAIVLAILTLAVVAIGIDSCFRSTYVIVKRTDWQQDTKYITPSATVTVFRLGRLARIPLSPGPPTTKSEQIDREFTIEYGPTAPMPVSEGVSLVPIALLLAAFPVGLMIVRARRRVVPLGVGRAIASTSLTLTLFIAEIACVLAIVFWVRSYPYFERFDWRVIHSPAAVQVNSSLGSLMFAWTESGPNHSLPGEAVLFTRSTIPPTRGPLFEAAGLVVTTFHRLGFTVGSDGTTSLPWNVVIVPWWFVMLPLVGLWFIVSTGQRHHRRGERWMRVGRCRVCGYDLRGSRERCPECGTAMPTVRGVAR